MVNIKKHLISTLKPLNTPVYFATNFNSNEDTYMVFFIDSTSTGSVIDDEEAVIQHEITLYLNSKGDYYDLSVEALKLLKANGYKRVYEAEDFDNETKYYTKAIKLEYLDFLI